MKGYLDAIDRKILKFLIQNARMPYLEIARECGISGAAIHQRIHKLTVGFAATRRTAEENLGCGGIHKGLLLFRDREMQLQESTSSVTESEESSVLWLLSASKRYLTNDASNRLVSPLSIR